MKKIWIPLLLVILGIAGTAIADTDTCTITPSITETCTITPSITETSTCTETPSITVTPSITPTDTATDTRTITLTHTRTSTITKTITQTWTSTITKSITQTRTSTVTCTPSISPTFTPTITVTFVPGANIVCEILPTITVVLPAPQTYDLPLSFVPSGSVGITLFDITTNRFISTAPLPFVSPDILNAYADWSPGLMAYTIVGTNTLRIRFGNRCLIFYPGHSYKVYVSYSTVVQP